MFTDQYIESIFTKYVDLLEQNNEKHIIDRDLLRMELQKIQSSNNVLASKFDELKKRSANAILQRNKVITALIKQIQKATKNKKLALKNTHLLMMVNKLSIDEENMDDIVFEVLNFIEDLESQELI